MQVQVFTSLAWDGLEAKSCTFRQKDFPSHFHYEYCIGAVTHGFEKMWVNDREWIIPAGAVVILQPGQVHAHACVNKDAWSYQCLYINPDVFHFLAGVDCPPVFSAPVIEDPLLYQWLVGTPVEQYFTASFLYRLVHLAMRHTRQHAPLPGFSVSSSQIESVALYLRESSTTSVDLDALSQRFHVNKFTLIRAFKKQTGLSPGSYLMMNRILKACDLLSDGMPVVDVALESGFYDQPHFNKYFKKYVGVPATSYQKNVKKI